MKKKVLITAILGVVVMIFILWASASCGRLSIMEPEVIKTTESPTSLEVELNKDFSIVKVEKLNNNFSNIDAFGQSLLIGDYYIYVKATRILLPTKKTAVTDLKRLGSKELLINDGSAVGGYVFVSVFLLDTSKTEINEFVIF